jgi:hypothetical protein
VEDSALRGGFFNLSLEARREHLVRAVFEGVAYNTRWLLEAVEGFLRHRVDHIRLGVTQLAVPSFPCHHDSRSNPPPARGGQANESTQVG